jgi:hypothetical protein
MAAEVDALCVSETAAVFSGNMGKIDGHVTGHAGGCRNLSVRPSGFHDAGASFACRVNGLLGRQPRPLPKSWRPHGASLPRRSQWQKAWCRPEPGPEPGPEPEPEPEPGPEPGPEPEPEPEPGPEPEPQLEPEPEPSLKMLACELPCKSYDAAGLLGRLTTRTWQLHKRPPRPRQTRPRLWHWPNFVRVTPPSVSLQNNQMAV